MENKCGQEYCEFEAHHREDVGQCHRDYSKARDEHCVKDKTTGMWYCAFHQAMREARVEILKAKILKAWNSQLEKSAEAVFEAMEVKWRSTLTKEKAKEDLKENLHKIMTEVKTK